MLKHICSHPVEQMLTAGAFCAAASSSGIPRLRVAFLEANCSWVPFLLWRMDEHWEWLGDDLRARADDGPQRVLQAAVLRVGRVRRGAGEARHRAIGDDRIVFSTDFPHGDSKFPQAVESFLELPISEESKRKILWDNCAAYYGLPS